MKAFVFPGQGAQFVGMGKDLYETNPLAKELFDIPRMFDEEQGEIVYSGRNFVRRFIIQGTPVVAKRFKRVNFFQQIASPAQPWRILLTFS